MRKLLFLFLMLPALSYAQPGRVKLSALAIAPGVNDGTSFVGVIDSAGFYKDRRFTIADLVDYINTYVGATPAIAAVTAGAGTGCSANISGSDYSSVISLTTGVPCAGSAKVITYTFSSPFAVAPRVVLLGGANDNAADLTGTKQVRVKNITTAGFEIYAGSTALSNSTVYQFFCLVKQ